MSAPVLFLDFDGVLNHAKTTERFSFPNGGRFTGIDPRNVARLNRIMEAVPDALIVVSSTWRLHLSLGGLRRALMEAGFQHAARVVDVTPQWRVHVECGGGSNITGTYGCRGEEIQAWIDAQESKPSAVAILDDAEDMAHLDCRLVRTDLWGGGLSDEHAERVIAMLRESAREAA